MLRFTRRCLVPCRRSSGAGWLVLAIILTVSQSASGQFGACCFDDGLCLDGFTALECIQFGGDYQGTGSTCAGSSCTPIGGCCFDDGSCAILSSLTCTLSGGSYRGDGTTCAGAVCPVACGPGTGGCFEVNGSPACDDTACCNLVCDIDPFCCTNTWDSLCTSEAAQLCANCGSDDAGSCFLSNGSVGCDDLDCCEEICAIDSFCCEVFWDSICADAALANCTPTEPVNDFCGSPLEVVTGHTPFVTLGASTDGPSHPTCEYDGQTYGDVWYQHVATCTGNLTVTTCESYGASADYDTDLVIYDGCDCTTLALLGCNDDDFLCAADIFHSTVTVDVTEGNCYLVRVGGWNDGDVGIGAIVVDCVEAPCPCDLDGDGFVEVDDLLLVIGSWGTGDGDCNGDGTTDVNDLLLVIGAWGACV